MKIDYLQLLRDLDACNESVEWVRKYPSPQAAWDDCTTPAWRTWYLDVYCRALRRRLRTAPNRRKRRYWRVRYRKFVARLCEVYDRLEAYDRECGDSPPDNVYRSGLIRRLFPTLPDPRVLLCLANQFAVTS